MEGVQEFISNELNGVTSGLLGLKDAKILLVKPTINKHVPEPIALLAQVEGFGRSLTTVAFS